MSDPYHTPVLLQACIQYLDVKPGGTYIDLTFGGGGHSAAIHQRLDADGKLFAFDQDEDAHSNAPSDPRFTLIPQNFRHMKNYLKLQGVRSVDGILGDLGVSSHQFDSAERGFSIRFESELDMRMNRSGGLTARDIVNNYDEHELKRIFREYGEIRNTAKLVSAIIEARSKGTVATTEQLKAAIAPCAPVYERNKFLAKVFQALRIEVNDEMNALRECLIQCMELLESGGRLVMISYHSLEDRMVKNLIRTGDPDGKEEKDIIYGTSQKVFRNLTPKPVTPDEDEVRRNSRARSAKLRAAEKL